jgi:hypothetical protein
MFSGLNCLGIKLSRIDFAFSRCANALVLRGNKTVSKQAIASLLILRRFASAEDFN